MTEIDASSTHVAHDAAGNMTKVPVPGSWSSHYDLTWDAWNRLVKVQSGEDTVAEYEYDGLNRRIVKGAYVSGTHDHDEHFYLSEQNQVLEVRLDSGTDPWKQFTWGTRYVDDLVMRTRDTDSNGSLDETLYALQDGNWNVTAIADTSGSIVERFKYDPYGHATVLDADFTDDADDTSDYAWEYRFTSREFDAETGLDYFRARYYHDGLGRFLTRDPIGYADGPSLYEPYFVSGGSDPYGTTSYWTCVGKILWVETTMAGCAGAIGGGGYGCGLICLSGNASLCAACVTSIGTMLIPDVCNTFLDAFHDVPCECY